MAYVNFVKSKNLSDSISNSKSNTNKLYFPNNDESIILNGKKYGVPTIKGKINLQNIDEIKTAQSLLIQTNEVAFYLITDNQGKIPSTQSCYTVQSENVKQLQLTSPSITTNAALSIATSNINIEAIGVNVGDLIAITRVKVKVSDLVSAIGINLSFSGEIEIYQYKIFSTNDAKPTGHSEASTGVMGLMSPWDKDQVNKISTIESNLATASSELNRGNKKTMFTADNYNIDQCLDGGIYLYGRTGRSMNGNHSDEYYIVSVDTRYNRNDNKYYVTQRVYSVNYKNRAFERLIITSATNNYNGTYNDWIQLTEEQYMSENDVNDFITIRNWYNSIVGTDSDEVINKYQEIVDFLANISEGDTLNTIITAFETAINNQTIQHQTDINNINTEITKIKDGTTTVGNATKAIQDGNGRIIDATYAEKTTATTSTDGLMSADDKEKLDDIETGANKYSLPVASSTTRGGVKIGYSRDGNNFGVALSNENMYVNIPNATQSLPGLLSADDKLKVDEITSMQETIENIKKTNATIHSGGKFNIAQSNASNALNTIMNNYNEGDIVLFIISDSDGNYPSTSSRVNVDSSLLSSINYFMSTSARGANVGDMLLVTKQKITLLTLNVCKIIPLNDAKVATSDYAGTEGLVTVWDKEQINKISSIQNTANNAMPKSNVFPSRSSSNMNDARYSGVYPWCTLGRPAGSTGAYTCVVKRTTTDDGAYNTIEQTAYGRQGELGQVYKRIIFEKTDGTDTQFGEWIKISNDNNNEFNTHCAIIKSENYVQIENSSLGFGISLISVDATDNSYSVPSFSTDSEIIVMDIDYTYTIDIESNTIVDKIPTKSQIYATKEELNEILGDMNTILESIING